MVTILLLCEVNVTECKLLITMQLSNIFFGFVLLFVVVCMFQDADALKECKNCSKNVKSGNQKEKLAKYENFTGEKRNLLPSLRAEAPDKKSNMVDSRESKKLKLNEQSRIEKLSKSMKRMTQKDLSDQLSATNNKTKDKKLHKEKEKQVKATKFNGKKVDANRASKHLKTQRDESTQKKN